MLVSFRFAISRFQAAMGIRGRVRQSRTGSREPSPRGLGLTASILALITELLAGGTRAKGPPLRGVVITARRPGALLTGLATALAVGSRRSGVAITAPTSGAILQASASLRPSIRRYALEGRLV